MVQYRIPTEASIEDDLEEKANVVHTHTTADIATVAGVASDATFLRGDNTWAVPPGTGGGGTGGVSDHGDLTGLADDDHPQYLTQPRGDARYIQGSTASPTGLSVLEAASQAAARAAIGAGTSDLALGTTASTAKAGNYAPTKADVGLGNVDNTADSAKPVSTAQNTAIQARAEKAFAEAVVFHDGTPGGGSRPTGYARVVWVNPVGTTYARPTNMLAGDEWETDA